MFVFQQQEVREAATVATDWLLPSGDPPQTQERQQRRGRESVPERGDLREQAYRAYVTRASSGDKDNTPLIDQLLKLRQEKCTLLGY